MDWRRNGTTIFSAPIFKTLTGGAIAVSLGASVIAVTLISMGKWLPWQDFPHDHETLPPSLTNPAVSPSGNSLPPFPQQSPTRQGADVLAQLDAHHATPFVAPSASQSLTLLDALRRAMTVSVFDTLAHRPDPEGLFETAAWAAACQAGTLPDAAVRCNDSRLQDARYADQMLAQAAGAGQAGAIIELALRYPAQWAAIPLGNGVMLDDAIYSLAQHGDLRALSLIQQACVSPETCQNKQLTRNVLYLLMMRTTGTNAVAVEDGQQLEGDAQAQQQARARASQIQLLH
ncbi:hypothetical protein FPJ27_14810 [Burkholderia sp. MS455]|uniref:hypothetical protein n=1 Tax=Burkholderia sp. MS455 TaxID=2811788 RepID=UPI001957E89A|nr:hypothetical protein [Burkholderia sp. MS455]QRR07567.1 hypothetical protein FPJ27_14810 [Burkholderia sp. MS455]